MSFHRGGRRYATRILWIVLVVGVLAGLRITSDCIATCGNTTHKRAPTAGRELADLQAAQDVGAVADEEYQPLRKPLMEQCKKRWGY